MTGPASLIPSDSSPPSVVERTAGVKVRGTDPGDAFESGVDGPDDDAEVFGDVDRPGHWLSYAASNIAQLRRAAE